MQEKELQIYLQSTETINFKHPLVLEFIASHTNEKDTKKAQAISLYKAVRDTIPYDAFTFSVQKEDYKASATIDAGIGFCTTKSIVYTACCRAIGIPAKLGFADVKNHLSTNVLRLMLETDIYYWHAYVLLYLDDKWVKATPVFDTQLCEKYKITPLQFDGSNDSIYHPYDQEGNQHMEYLNDRGTYADMPFEEMVADMFRYYPAFMERV